MKPLRLLVVIATVLLLVASGVAAARLSPKTLAVLAGAVAGVLAAIPTSLLIVAITRRQYERPQALPHSADPIDMRERRHGYFPKLFVWRGHRYRVNAVERCWTVSRHSGGNGVERHCFRVRCPEGTFEVHQDVRLNAWYVERQIAPPPTEAAPITCLMR